MLRTLFVLNRRVDIAMAEGIDQASAERQRHVTSSPKRMPVCDSS